MLMFFVGILGIVGEFLGIFRQNDSGNFYTQIWTFFSLGWQPCRE
jgi:hypothetical protein